MVSHLLDFALQGFLYTGLRIDLGPHGRAKPNASWGGRPREEKRKKDEDAEKEKRPSPGVAQNRKSLVFKLFTPNDRF